MNTKHVIDARHEDGIFKVTRTTITKTRAAEPALAQNFKIRWMFRIARGMSTVAWLLYFKRMSPLYAALRRAALVSLISPAYKLGRILNTRAPHPWGRALIRFSQRIHSEFLFEGMLRRAPGKLAPPFTKTGRGGSCISRAIESANREMAENRLATRLALDALRNEAIRKKKQGARRK